ncbi:hypothetical protein ACFUJY_11885 [Streptomyces sp. NPDC057249]|uniref:hypothetical protein n=1 Tax=Streptomyces sp. NPDC057249 TaxID=3346067 RepID=UPI00362EE5E4
MYVFMDTAPGDGPGRDDDELLVRTAMERATDGAPPLPDLVPGARAEGRRRRVRARAAVGATALAIVGLGLFGAALPVWGGDGEPARGWSAASQTSPVPTPTSAPVPVRAPVHVEPSPGESSMADLPERESSRQRGFQNEAAAVLESLLPEALGPVRPVDIAVNRYQGGADGGPAFPLSFSVRPLATGKAARADRACLDVAVKHLRCDEVSLPGGMMAQAITAAGNAEGGKTVTSVTVRFTYGHSRVTLAVGGDTDAMVSAPVTADDLLVVARDARFMELVAYADARPMEAREGSVRGG